MELFDCNCCYGQMARPAMRHAPDAAGLLAEMDFCGIDRALPYHAGMRFGVAAEWNNRLSAEIRDVPRLHPTWTILPAQTGEMPEASALLAAMRDHGVRALRAFPDEHHYRLNRATFGELFDLLTERRVPLFVKQNIVAVGDLLAEFPGLIVVAVNQGPHSLERYLRPLMDRYDGLHVETSHHMVAGLIEESVERYGPGRLLFGSGFPDVCSGAALLRLAHAEIGEDARAAIAGANLERLLREVRL